jgi:hypothetical protein
MAGPCQICRASNRLVTENHITGGKLSVVEISKKTGFNTAAIYNHKKHMAPRLGLTLAASAPPVPPMKALPPDATDLQKVDAELEWLEERRRGLVGKQVAEKDIAALTGQLLTARRLRAKIAGGEITPGQYARSAHFHRIWDGVVRALEAHPKALTAAMAAVLEATGLREEEL